MDPANLVSALIGARVGEMQLAVAAKMMRMNAGMESSVAKLIESAQQSMDPLANVAAGIGARLDWDEAPLQDARPLRAAVATAFLGDSRCAGAQGIAADLRANLEIIRKRALTVETDPPRGYGRGF